MRLRLHSQAPRGASSDRSSPAALANAVERTLASLGEQESQSCGARPLGETLGTAELLATRARLLVRAGPPGPRLPQRVSIAGSSPTSSICCGRWRCRRTWCATRAWTPSTWSRPRCTACRPSPATWSIWPPTPPARRSGQRAGAAAARAGRWWRRWTSRDATCRSPTATPPTANQAGSRLAEVLDPPFQALGIGARQLVDLVRAGAGADPARRAPEPIGRLLDQAGVTLTALVKTQEAGHQWIGHTLEGADRALRGAESTQHRGGAGVLRAGGRRWCW